MAAEGMGPQPASKASVRLRLWSVRCGSFDGLKGSDRNFISANDCAGGSATVTLIPILVPAQVRPGVIPSIRA